MYKQSVLLANRKAKGIGRPGHVAWRWSIGIQHTQRAKCMELAASLSWGLILQTIDVNLAKSIMTSIQKVNEQIIVK